MWGRMGGLEIRRLEGGEAGKEAIRDSITNIGLVSNMEGVDLAGGGVLEAFYSGMNG